ncbi:GntR family transcriptional regulator [Kitasatospora sp. MMS16-BH015]|uniref:GntR family transcriptional regulator n=1 Tax=Kitasatospora sp. MMS16-BH015 TaxID=2018025 RepID=UPI000CA099DC|nr:GntR family transcriptional regulator [Kitasatospora sp. MMS16-BH015]AUG76808.1 GntR family transcriptional regulator [Kitasatospora sp. MMS16-BH015]
MHLTIDPASPTPPYEQLRSQLADQARAGTLPTGLKLPTVRALAEQLGLAPNTVARAYRELESDGIVETHGRKGTTIAAPGDTAHRLAAAAATEYAARAHHLGLTKEEATAAVLTALQLHY